MSGSLSTWLETALLNLAFAGGTFVPPSTLWVALFSVVPTPDAPTNEITGGSYGRQPVMFNTASGSPPTMANTEALQWPTATTDWGVVAAGGVFDNPALGNFLGSAALVSAVDGVTPAPLVVNAGMIFRLPAAGLVLGFVATPPTQVPFVPGPDVRNIERRMSMRPVVGEVIDGAGVGRMGLRMVGSDRR